MEKIVREIVEPMISNKSALMIKTVPAVDNEPAEIIVIAVRDILNIIMKLC